MQYLTILEQPTDEAVRAFAKKHNLVDVLPEYYQHPQEDYLAASESPPAFVVADGVTLAFKTLAERREPYPNPSPAGDVAKIFCEEILREVEPRYDTFDVNDIVPVFEAANAAVRRYNNKTGKTDISGNMTGFFAATGAFAVLRKDKVCWAAICDSLIVHFDKNMNKKFASSGNCKPYAVINGEERMSQQLEYGVRDMNEGDRFFVATDGFEEYVENEEFLKLFITWDATLEDRIASFSREMNAKDPEGYGHERSLIAISF